MTKPTMALLDWDGTDVVESQLRQYVQKRQAILRNPISSTIHQRVQTSGTKYDQEQRGSTVQVEEDRTCGVGLCIEHKFLWLR
jgi:hypothetical protein